MYRGPSADPDDAGRPRAFGSLVIQPAVSGGRLRLGRMSPERDELLRLVQEIPDDAVPAVLADVRRRLAPAEERPWPPAWFGSFASGRADLASNHDDILAEGFGRS